MNEPHKIPTMILLAIVVLVISPPLVRCQDNGPIVFSLVEEQKSETLVGNVAEKAGIQNTLPPEVFRQLEYQILSAETLRIGSLFKIDSSTGDLYTNAMIDREQVCDATAVICELEFDVTVKQGVTVIRLLNVKVVIEDINDNKPSFPTKELDLSFSEAAPVNSEISITGAIDRDAGLASSISYWMNDSDVFSLKEDKQIDVSLLKLVLLKSLDRETESSYNLIIYAKDGDSATSLTGTLAVTVTVTDMNDHRPEFSQRIFNFTVAENAALGSLVGKIEASDEDSGKNGEISFQFSSLVSSTVTQLFSLDEVSGEVKVKADLQYESGKSFRVVVEAKDKGGSPQATQAVLVLNVIDAGNTPPRLTLTLAAPHGQDSAKLSEGLQVGWFVGTLKYEDTDDGVNGEVSCSSLSPYFSLQPLEDNSYSIVIKKQLNREDKSEVFVVLMCEDGGNPSLSSIANFTTVVADVNDEHPVFKTSGYTAEVSEGVDSVPNLLQVSATDADDDINSEVRYQLSANSSNAFSIDPFSGWLSLTSSVDREAGSVIQLTVLAVDRGEPKLTGSVAVSVNVLDINDNEPQVVRLDYQIRENQAPGTFVAQILGDDNDSGVNGDLRYRLVKDSTGSFVVSDSGIISTTKTFNREKVDHYPIVVEVSDKGSPSLSSTATVTISITDANDHSPVITYPVPGNDSITISANLSPGTVVTKMQAKDGDIGKNAKLLYLIVEGNPLKIFSIDNATGTIFISRRLTSSRETSYRLTISVQDSGVPRRHNSTFLYLTIDFSNATMLGGDSSSDHRYVVIAGVIAGVTFVIAVIIIAIILKLRHMDITQCSGRAAKTKTVHPTVGQRPANAVTVKDRGALAVGVTGNTFRNDQQADRDAGFGDDRYADNKNLHTSFDNYGPRDFVTQVNVPERNRAVDERDSNGLPLPILPDALQQPGNDDVISDNSADVTNSDSGRGASDTEEAPSSGGLPALAPRQPLNTTASSSLSIPPWGTSRPPSSLASYNQTSKPSDLFGPGSQSLDDASGLGCLPRSARAYASHKDFQKPRRPAGKVRFSVDDQAVDKTSATSSWNSVPHVYWTGDSKPQGGNSPTSSAKPSSFSWQSPQAQCGFRQQSPHTIQAPTHSQRMSNSNSLQSFSNPNQNLQPQNKLSTSNLYSFTNDHVQSTALPSSQSATPPTSSTVNPSLSQPDLCMGLAGKTPYNTTRYQQPLKSGPPTSLLAPPTSRSAPPNPSFPLLPLQRGHHQGRPYSNRGLLPPMNASIDEDEDDGGSTTTSGSYAVDDMLNISVEC